MNERKSTNIPKLGGEKLSVFSRADREHAKIDLRFIGTF